MWVKVGPEALPLSVEVYSLCFDKEVKWSVYINNCSVLYKPVDVMLCSMFAVRHLEYTSHAEQGFLCIPVCYHLCGGKEEADRTSNTWEQQGWNKKWPVSPRSCPDPLAAAAHGSESWLRSHHTATGKASWVTGWNWLKGHHVAHPLCFRSPVGRLPPVFPTQELINTTNLCSTITQPRLGHIWWTQWFKVTASGSLQTPDSNGKNGEVSWNLWKITKMFVHAHRQLSLFILSVYSAQFQENYSEVSGMVCLVSNGD